VNVAELIALLEDVDPEAEVLLGHQPSWPLQFTVAGIAEWDGGTDGEDDEYVPAAYEQERREVGLDDSPPRIYIVEGSHPDDTPYAPREIWDIARSA
jgi:hypothetical protein